MEKENCSNKGIKDYIQKIIYLVFNLYKPHSSPFLIGLVRYDAFIFKWQDKIHVIEIRTFQILFRHIFRQLPLHDFKYI